MSAADPRNLLWIAAIVILTLYCDKGLACAPLVKSVPNLVPPSTPHGEWLVVPDRPRATLADFVARGDSVVMARIVSNVVYQAAHKQHVSMRILRGWGSTIPRSYTHEAYFGVGSCQRQPLPLARGERVYFRFYGNQSSLVSDDDIRADLPLLGTPDFHNLRSGHLVRKQNGR